MIERYAPSSKKDRIPILSGEWGYSTFKRGVTLETQAAFAARQQLSNLLNGVPLSIWYDWKNDGPDPNENEHNFGTVRPDLEPKPAYVALRTLTHQLSGYRVAAAPPAAERPGLRPALPESGWRTESWPRGRWVSHTRSASKSSLKGETKPAAVNSKGERLTPKIESGRLALDLVSCPAVRDAG